MLAVLEGQAHTSGESGAVRVWRLQPQSRACAHSAPLSLSASHRLSRSCSKPRSSCKSISASSMQQKCRKFMIRLADAQSNARAPTSESECGVRLTLVSCGCSLALCCLSICAGESRARRRLAFKGSLAFSWRRRQEAQISSIITQSLSQSLAISHPQSLSASQRSRVG